MADESEITTFGTAMEEIKAGQFVLIEPVDDNRVWRPYPETKQAHPDWQHAVALNDAKTGERVKCVVRGAISGQMPDSPYFLKPGEGKAE